MSPALLQLYLEQAALLAVGALVLTAAWRWSTHSPRPSLSPPRWRRACLIVMAAAALLPLATRAIPRRSMERPRPGVAADRRPARPGRLAAWTAAPLSMPAPQYRWRFSSSDQAMARGLLLFVAGGTLLALARRAGQRRRLSAWLEVLPVMRRQGRVTIAVSDTATVPFAARAAGRAWVVVPADLLEDAGSLRLLLAHELQHHRQRDLQTSAVVDAVAAFFFWNPALWRWQRLLEEAQELSCDAAVVGRGRARPRDYAELLLRAAAPSARTRFLPAGVSAASGGGALLLRRRIAMLMTSDGTRASSRAWWAAAGCLVVLSAVAVAARSAVVEKKLEAADVSPLAEKLARHGVTAPVNDVVLAEVNRWVATPKERAFLREARRRLAEQRVMVDAALARHDVPSALAAVAIVESGFMNLGPKEGFQGAGVWQFIPETARHFGLHVDAARDERLDVERQTEAAARYLATLHKRFDDWPLALAGYNEGGRKVQSVIDQARTRDAWALMRSGHLGRYAATVVAAALVLEGDERLLD
jgi:peptidoglycan lytic transglycosylase D